MELPAIIHGQIIEAWMIEHGDSSESRLIEQDDSGEDVGVMTARLYASILPTKTPARRLIH